MLKDSRGSIAVGFALSLVPILGLVAALVEYSRVIGVRTELNALADRATLAAAIAIDPRRSDTWVRGTPDPRPIMQNAFEQAALERAGASNASLTATYTVETVDGVPEVRICYEVIVPTIIGEFIDKGNITATNCVTARSAAPTFTNIHVMIDASGSMGIGASSEDQTIMRNTVGCMFACHTTNWRSVEQPSLCSNKGWWSQSTFCAHQNGARTRFDVARSAIVDMIERASELPPTSGSFAFSVSKFGNYSTTIHPLSTDYDSLIAAVTAMEPDIEGAGTNVRRAMTEIARTIPASGDGSSAELAMNHLFVVTDGLENNVYEVCNGNPCRFNGSWIRDPDLVNATPGYWSGNQRRQVFDDAGCEPLKRQNVRISTLQLEYVGADHRMRTDLLPHIRSRMESCASQSSMVYLANSATEVERAIEEMFLHVEEMARLVE